MEEKNLMSWLNKANGWQRLWLVYVILVVLYAASSPGDAVEVWGEGGNFFVAIFLTAVIPYALGTVISWVIKGFKG